MNFENMNIWCWLIPLLVGVICGILGYLIGKMSRSTSTTINPEEIKILKERNTKLEVDLATCNRKLTKPSNISGSVTPAAVAATAAISAVSFDKTAAKAAFGKAIKQDDLKVVEGIGPKIEQLFHSFDIKTWQALSDASVDKCQEVLNSGGDRYKVHNPGSWPMQAKMAYEGKWKKLSKWQNEHKAGKL
ncbi:MAG: hypothetical protein V3U92_07320 [Cellulophaga sp.]